jgi:transposase
MAPLRKRTFFSLSELNRALAELTDRLNRHPFQKLAGSRLSIYEELERPALRPLPPQRYEFAEWKRASVNIDYHIELDHNFYSVPYALIHKEVEARLTLTTVEVFFRGRRVASHARAHGRGHFATDLTHMARSPPALARPDALRLISQAGAIGPETARFVQAILADRPHPEQGYRACLGVVHLAKRYPGERMETAAQRANWSGVRSRKAPPVHP